MQLIVVVGTYKGLMGMFRVLGKTQKESRVEYAGILKKYTHGKWPPVEKCSLNLIYDYLVVVQNYLYSAATTPYSSKSDATCTVTRTYLFDCQLYLFLLHMYPPNIMYVFGHRPHPTSLANNTRWAK